MNISEEARIKRNQYYREWRKKNPEKNLKIQQRYWDKKRKEIEIKEKAEKEGCVDG